MTRPTAGSLVCGARILAGRGRFQVVTNLADTAVIRLDSGEVSLHVPRLRRGHKVEVATSDARVRVKGTRFTVRKESGGATTVAVTQGVVWLYPAGRSRRTVVLGPGDRKTVLGEIAFLATVLKQVQAAVAIGDLHGAVRFGRRYLAVTTKPRQSTHVRLTLAAALGRLGRIQAAARLYERVASRSGQSAARQNALALMARLFGRAGRRTKAEAAWRQMLKRFPRGIHAREALLELVRLTCRAQTPAARAYRQQLGRRYPRDKAVSVTLRACGARFP